MRHHVFVMTMGAMLLCVWTPAQAQQGREFAKERPRRSLELVEDIRATTQDSRYQGRTQRVSVGVELGMVMRQFWPFGPGISLGDVEKRYPDGASRHVPVRAWLQLTLPVLRTRRGVLVGVENESTVGASFAKHLEERRTLVWSTRGHLAISAPLNWGDDDVLTLFGGAQLEQAPRYWWLAQSRLATHGSFGFRFNYIDSSDGVPAEYGYDYQPLVSRPDGNVSIDGMIVGVPTHTAHRIWLDPTEGFRITYINRRVRFFDESLPALRTHEFSVTLHL